MFRSASKAALAGAAIALLQLCLPARADTEAKIVVKHDDDLGDYIADGSGAPLYLFTTDKQGAGYATPSSSCSGKCLEVWPPFYVGKSPAPGDGVKPELIGTMNAGGKSQATYNGWPLYTFVKDKGEDEPEGNDKHGFGGEWYLLTPAGEKVHEHEDHD